MTTCWSCAKVKGKRVCPANSGRLICSKCCGTKRRTEIHCPDNCRFLEGADPGWHSISHQKEDARFLSRFVQLDKQQLIFILFLHKLLLSEESRFFSLSDEELSEVINTSSKTLDTHSKGIVYSHPSSSLHLEKYTKWLVDIIIGRDNIKGAPDASVNDIHQVFKTLNQAISEHSNGNVKRSSYLETAQRVLKSTIGNVPDIELSEKPDGPPSQLIVPP